MQPSSPGPRASVDVRKLRSETKVLLVDDDAAVRTTLQRVLQSRGYQVFACTSGGEALVHLAAGGYDAMVSDVHIAGHERPQIAARRPRP
ncbi:MAG: response regulator [Pseudomonadota bacterium]